MAIPVTIGSPMKIAVSILMLTRVKSVIMQWSVKHVDSHNWVTKPISLAKVVPCAKYELCYIIRVIKPGLAGIPCTKLDHY